MWAHNRERVRTSALVCGLFVLQATACDSGKRQDPAISDHLTLRCLARLLADAQWPIANDGSVDVYKALLTPDPHRKTSPPDYPKLVASDRFGFGPTMAEIQADDYSRFPYERFRGQVDGTTVVPVLWDRLEPGVNEVMVVFSDLEVRTVGRDQMLELLRSLGQR